MTLSPVAPTTSPIGLRPYQIEAIDAIAAGLATGGRGQLHAACGSGKTLIGIKAADRLVNGPGLIVVLVPSLALTAQVLTEWRAHTRLDAVLAVCSDDTVTDAPVHLVDLPAHTTTDVDQITTWVQGSGRRLVVSTYVSASRLAEALRTLDRPADLVLYDEAHHLAGRPEFTTRRVLEQPFLPARRRLFMTATPRIDDARADSVGALSMDDVALFGPVLYHYPFARAISDGYLDDYRIVVMGISRSRLWELLRDEATDYVERPGAPELRMLASQALIAKAARTFGLRRILVFCPRVAEAQEFTSTLEPTLGRLDSHERPDGALSVGRVIGQMNQAQREEVLDRLRNPPGAWSVVTNVRCLSEGVDVPAVDAVAFTSPKSSQVDIIQAVGRALRRTPGGSGVATIIVPIVIPDSAEEVGDLDPGEFRVLWQVVRALRAHDDMLGIELDIQRSHDTTYNPGLPDKITVELGENTTGKVLDELSALLVRQTTSMWWEGYGHARAYANEHGHLDVPSTYTTADGFGLGRWILNARQHRRKGWLRPERIEALERLGMIWNTRHRTWERFIAELKAYRERTGHTLVPQNYVAPSGYRLGSQVNVARTRPYRIPTQVHATLDEMGMVWNARDALWQSLFDAAVEYHAKHGHLRPSADYVDADGYRLGSALKPRRKKARAGTLDPAEKASLDELDPRWCDEHDPWKEFLAAADRYVAAHDTLATVRRDYVDAEGYRLGQAINYYRNLNSGVKKSGGWTAERKAALDERGMVWRTVGADARAIRTEEVKVLRSLSGNDLGTEVLRLLDEKGVTQSSIAAELGMHRSYLNTKVKKFRHSGHWPDRKRSDRR